MPFRYATKNDYIAIVKLLFEKFPFTNWNRTGGRTLLSWADQNGHEAIVKILLENGVVAVSESSGTRL